MQNNQRADEINQQSQIMNSTNPQSQKQIAKISKIKIVKWTNIKTQNEEKAQDSNLQDSNQMKEIFKTQFVQTQDIYIDSKNQQKQTNQIYVVSNSQGNQTKQFIKTPNIGSDQNEQKSFFETTNISNVQQSQKQILKQQIVNSIQTIATQNQQKVQFLNTFQKNTQQINMNNTRIKDNFNFQSNQIQLQQNKLIKQLSQLTLNQNQNKLNKQIFINQILLKYKIDQEDYQDVKKQFYQSNITECCKYTKKNLRQNMQEQLKMFIKMFNEQQNINKKEQNFQQILQKFVNQLLSKYSIDEDDKEDLMKQINNRKIQESLKYAKKKHRQEMKTQIQLFFTVYNKSDNSSQQVLTQNNFKYQTSKLMKEYGIQDEQIDAYYKQIKQGKNQNVINDIKGKKRPQFKQKLQKLLEKYEKFITITHKAEFNLKIKLDQELFQIVLKNGTQELREKLREQYDITDLNQYCMYFKNKNIQKLQQIFNEGKNQGLLKLVKKIQLTYQFNKKNYKIWVSKSFGNKQIKSQIIKDMIQKNICHDNENKIHIKFKTDKQITQAITNIEDHETNYGKIKLIIVERNVQVTIYYQNQQKVYNLKSLNTFLDLKKFIQIDFIPKEAQCLSYQKQKSNIIIKEQQQENLITSILQNQKNYIQLTLTNAHTTQFYGFHSNRSLSYQKFSQFVIDDQIQLIQIIKNCDFSQSNLEKIFFDNFLNFLYSCIKKRFPIQTVIEKIRELVVKNKFQNIWMPIQQGKPRKMNQSFILVYLLRNADKRLQIQIMNLVKSLMPLPIYINRFDSIFDSNNKIQLNHQIMWVLKKGITICSVGIHTQNFSAQKGKSSLLNQIFFTNFCLSQSKHKLIKNIPYIAVRVYDDLFPLNIIDIPHGCSDQIRNNLLQASQIIFLNSWRNEQVTLQRTKNIQKKYKAKVLSILRDNTQLKRDYLKALNGICLKNKRLIKIPNLSNRQDNRGLIDILRQKINIFLFQSKQQFIKSKKIFNIIKNKQFQLLDSIIDNFEENNLDICKFSKNLTLMKQQKPQNQQKFNEQLKKQLINENIISLLEFINDSNFPRDIILMYFRQKLRSIQNQKISRYTIIYKIKQKLQKCDHNNQTQYNQALKNTDKVLSQLPLLYHSQISLIGKKSQEVMSIINSITSEFENNFKPNIFSNELFWRQIYAFMKFNPNFKLKNTSFFELITDLKSKQIMNNQPFQIIDGDSLQMPVDIMKKVFANIPDNCLVLTIIGPQSSGKSTLLNFLFGCDFATSQGRCTRGVYGTYFRINDLRYNFDGVFVIDTQGLFALTNQTDQKHYDRQNFDSKLVLFCLAISDFVIINVRGNLDKNTERILSICHEKLQTLDLNQDQKPEIVIVLNQNSTSKTEESQNQFKKIRKTLNFNISRSLSLAYLIKNYGKNQICLFSQSQILTKKTPFAQFRNQTASLLFEIVLRMKKRKTAQKIHIKIDKFAQTWTTVLTFPNLSQLTTKQYRKLQLNIKEWKKIKDEIFNMKVKQIIQSYNNQQIDKIKATNYLEQLNTKYLQQFQQEYRNQLASPQLKLLFQNQKKHIILKNDNNFLKLQYSLIEISIQKQMVKQKFEGDGIIKQMQKQIIRNQNNGIKLYTKQQKQEIFNKGFNQALQKIKKTLKWSEKHHLQLERIKSQYELLLKSSQSKLKGFGLPKQISNISSDDMIKNTYQQISLKLINKLLNQNINQSGNFMLFTERPYTNVLKGSPSDAKLNYFNILDYFKKQKRNKKFYISIDNLINQFNFSKFAFSLRNKKNYYKQQFGETLRLKQIYQNINNYLFKYFSLRIQSFNNFCEVYESKSCNILRSLWNTVTFNNIELHINKVEKSYNYHSHLNNNNHNFGGCYNYGNYYHQIKCEGCQTDIYSKFLKLKTEDIVIKRQESSWTSDNQNGKSKGKSVTKQINCLKSIYHVRQIVKDKIDWKKIQQNLKENSQNENINFNKNQVRKKVNSLMCNQINQDLNKINLHLNKQIDLLELFEKRKIKTQKKKKKKIYQFNNNHESYIQRQQRQIFEGIFEQIQIINDNLIIIDQSQWLYQFSNLKYFNGSKLQQQIKNNDSYQFDMLNLGNYEYEIFTTQNKEFQGYQQSNRQIKKRFQDKKFKDFIFKQIKFTKKSLDKFFKQILKIIDQVHQKWIRFDNKAILEVFSLVNQQISQFNNDLNQISHQIQPRITGYIHLMAIHLIWKLQIDSIVQKQNQPYLKKLSSRKEELQKFFKRTSNQLDSIVEQEVEAFIQQIQNKFSQFIDHQKYERLNFKILQFNSNISRKQIQRQIDIQIFSKDSAPQSILKYLQKPYQMIQNKYEENYKINWQEVLRAFKKQRYAESLLNQFDDCFTQMKNSIINIQKITQEKGSPRDLFEMVNKNSGNDDYDEEAKKILFDYFLDIILRRDNDKQRECLDITLKPKRSISVIQLPGKLLLQALLKLKKNTFQITNLAKFLTILTRQTVFERFKKNINGICQFNYLQQKNFINQIRIVICKQKCPCCGRICGIQQSHTFHKCLYGHQMRALAGNYITNNGKKQAYVVRCQQLKQTDMMVYNGNNYSWTSFKDYWAKKPTGGWLYDDLKDILEEEDRKRCQRAWLLAGPLYCKKNDIQYVDYNDAQVQRIKTVGKNHFIFALDQSGSMQGSPWNDLMKALSQIMIKINDFTNKIGQTYVSIINFHNSARTIYQRKKPNEINVNNIPFKNGGTNFESAFLAAYELANKYVNNQRIIFIFMTDGGDNYPSKGIEMLQNLMKNNPKMFIYSGIQFNSDNNVMKLISNALKGTNVMANNFEQLLTAYTSCLQVIAYKEAPQI